VYTIPKCRPKDTSAIRQAILAAVQGIRKLMAHSNIAQEERGRFLSYMSDGHIFSGCFWLQGSTILCTLDVPCKESKIPIVKCGCNIHTTVQKEL
jgi:hypothetical protein